MKQINFFLFSLFLCLSISAQNKVYTVNNIPKVRLADKTQYVSDPENILSQEAKDKMNSILFNLENQTTVETVVAVVPSIGSDDCFDFSHKLLNQWGVGKKGKDNGLVILLVIDQRCIQFYTGYGLEGDLPDAICKRIQTQDMLPYLKKEDWNNAMIVGVQAVYNRLHGISTGEISADDDDDEDDAWFIFLLLLFPILIVVFVFIIEAWRGRCPQCKKNKWQRTGSKVISVKNGIKTEEFYFVCRNCGYVKTIRQNSHDENFRGPRGGGPIIGGGFGGFGGGRSGGFGGGSFGGGRGGGGGAGTRF